MLRAMPIGLLLLSFALARAEPEILGQKESYWLKQASATEATTRRAAAFALGKLGIDAGPRVVGVLTKLLTDDDSAVRAGAARGIGDIARQLGKGAEPEWPHCEPALVVATEDREPRVRRAALEAIGNFGPIAVSALGAIRKSLADAEPEVRQNAAWAVGQIGVIEGEILTELCERLRDADPLVRRDSVVALSDLYQIEANRPRMTEVGPALVTLLQKEISSEAKLRDPVVLATTLEKMLGLGGLPLKDLAKTIGPLLRGEDENLARLAAYVLAGTEGADAAQGLAVLRRALRAGDPTTQEQAAAALGQLGERAEPALLDLAAALRPNHAGKVRRNAAIALGQFGKKARPALNHLIESIQLEARTPEEQSIRFYAVEAVALIGYPENAEALPILADLIRTEKDSQLRVRAVWSFLGAKQLDAKSLPVLTDLVREPGGNDTAGARLEAARVLAEVLRDKAPVEVVEVLHEGLISTGTFRFDGTGTRISAGNEQGQGSTVAENKSDPDGRYIYALGLGLIGKGVKAYPQVAKLKKDLNAARNEKERPRLNQAAKQALEATGL